MSNPQYLNFLAQSKYLENEAFLNYLEYLEYWREAEYAKYLVYPNCLHVLSLLKEPRFREEILRADVAKMLMDDFYATWIDNGTEQAANEEENGQKQKPTDNGGLAADSQAADGVKAEPTS